MKTTKKREKYTLATMKHDKLAIATKERENKRKEKGKGRC